MSVSYLSEAETRRLAKEIRKILEPANSTKSELILEGEIRRHISLNYDSRIQINGVSDILDILASHYAPCTLKRLESKIKKGAVLDTSICNMETEDLLKLFYENGEYVNIITSLTFQEIQRLAFSGKLNHHNATVLMNCILQDVNFEYSMTVPLQPCDTYVDTDLLDYCSTNGYALFTYDKRLTLRARSRQIRVYYLNKKIASPYHYSPNASGKDVILDESLLTSEHSLEDIISDANTLGCKRFLITRDFVEALEKENDRRHIKNFISFLLADENGDYSYYIPSHETSAEVVPLTETACEVLSMEALAEKYNAIVFTADPKKAFNFRISYSSCFWYVASCGERRIIQKAMHKKNFPLLHKPNPLSSNFGKSSANLDKSTGSSIAPVSNDSLHNDSSNTNSDTEPISCSSQKADSQVDGSIGEKVASKSSINKTPEVNRFVKVSFRKDNDIFCWIPGLNQETNCIKKRIRTAEKIWVLDNMGRFVELQSAIKVQFSVIQCINGLDGHYYINVYNVVEHKKALLGKLIYSKAFSRDTFKEITPEYRDYAEKGMLLT